ncbi:MAG TPA: glycosyltransferase, partial [Phnomibacter sp.]|nr:glycosyltransferase [Phnomibacter sp.]
MTIYMVLLAFYAWGWRLAAQKRKELGHQPDPVRVSVVVPARNEGANIATCLRGLAAQQYPAELLEIIVVNDASEDHTAEIVKEIAAHDARVKLVNLMAEKHLSAHKKRAIEAGIGAAGGQLILCTDADCVHGPTWVGLMAQAYAGGAKKFVAAPVVYRTHPTLLSVFQTLDFLTLQGITAASVASGFHTMCNGANIAYERDVFYEVDGFRGIDKLPTGDDMLLMYKVYRRYPAGIAYLLDPDAIVVTDAAPGWRAFFQQRIRWASKAAYYDDKRIFWVLMLVYFFNLWMLGLGFASIWVTTALWYFLALLVIKTLAELAFIWPVASFFGKKKWLPW